jgi:hypothetical protein
MEPQSNTENRSPKSFRGHKVCCILLIVFTLHFSLFIFNYSLLIVNCPLFSGWRLPTAYCGMIAACHCAAWNLCFSWLITACTAFSWGGCYSTKLTPRWGFSLFTFIYTLFTHCQMKAGYRIKQPVGLNYNSRRWNLRMQTRNNTRTL